jgi:hypothetical protein
LLVWIGRTPDGPAGEAAKTVMVYTFLVLPFLFGAALSWDLAKATGKTRPGWWLFVITTLVLGLNVYYGLHRASTFSAAKMWTAAALETAMIYPRSVVVVIACWIARRVLGRLYR